MSKFIDQMDADNNLIINLADPINDNDAVNKKYLISLIDNKQNKIVIQDTEPSINLTNNLLWIKTGITPLKIYLYDEKNSKFNDIGGEGNFSLDDWRQNYLYHIDDFVLYKSTDFTGIYKCIVEHTSSTDFDNSKWLSIGNNTTYINMVDFFYRPNSFILNSETNIDRISNQTIFTIPSLNITTDKIQVYLNNSLCSTKQYNIISDSQIQFNNEILPSDEITGFIYKIVTGNFDTTTANIMDTPNKRFVTDNEKQLINLIPNFSNYIVGNGGLLAFKLVYLNASDTVMTASSNNQSHFNKVLGFTKNNYSAGDTMIPISQGEITNSNWNLIPGNSYFLGVGGNITNLVPTIGFIQKVGIAKNSNTLIIKLDIPIKLI
jgi:hypothetical protein